jgi:hypothetical protein
MDGILELLAVAFGGSFHKGSSSTYLLVKEINNGIRKV